MKLLSLAIAVCAAAICFSPAGEAHKGVTSKFTYNVEVFPILLARCGQCHVAGGVGPMSLVSYEDAFPWAESLRTELLDTEGGPAAAADDFVAVAHRDLPARELDVILDWATGGTPEGDPAKAPSPVALRNDWTHGVPSLTIQLTAPFQMPADAMEASQEFVLPVSLSAPRGLSAIDVLPGTPAIVRDVQLQLREPGGGARTLGTWTPKQNPAPIVLNPPPQLLPGSAVIARFHYKKTWKYEGQPMTDRSTIGLYFSH